MIKKVVCAIMCASILLSCCNLNGIFAGENTESASEIPANKKTIYNFDCKEAEITLDATATISEVPVSYYIGYTDKFLIDSKIFAPFEHATLFIRDKLAANKVTYTRSAYGNNGNPYDGQDGRDYWMSFNITTGATVYMVDRENQQWPAKPDDWYLAGDIDGVNVYAKHFDADEKVNIPCYGWDESWDKKAARLFSNPSYFVVAWDNDVKLSQLTYKVDSGEEMMVNGFDAFDVGGQYNVELDYKADGYNVVSYVRTADLGATVEVSGEESFVLEHGTSQKIVYTVTSEAGDESAVYTVNYTMLDKKEPKITVNPILSSFGASPDLTNISMAGNYAGDTAKERVPIASCDENGYSPCARYKIVYSDGGKEYTAYISYDEIYDYIYAYDIVSAEAYEWQYTDENMYTINKGMDFFTDGGSFGVTGSAFDRAEHIMASSQYAPGNVKDSSFSNSGKAAEFRTWLCNDRNYMYEITPDYDCVIYVAFVQADAKNHTGFASNGWVFNDYSDVVIPKEALLDGFKGCAAPQWWMADPSYNFNGKPYLLVKNQYTTDGKTDSTGYFYIWSKEVKAGQKVRVPVGGSAFSDKNDKNAPKVLVNWRSSAMRDNVSGNIFCGLRSMFIKNSLDSYKMPTMIANIGDKLTFESEFGAKAEFSQSSITTLPCEIELTVTSEAGSKATCTLSFKKQPKITSVKTSAMRDKFVPNTGVNKIELSPYLVGELYQEERLRQVFEADENGVLQPAYDGNGKLLFENVTINVRRAFYSDRSQHKFAHVGDGFKNMQYFSIPSNDSVTRRETVYANENAAHVEKYGEEKTWEFAGGDSGVQILNHTDMASRYADYVLGDNEYFSFTASDSGVVYVALESESANFSAIKGWEKLSVNVPLPEGHAGWNSVEVDKTNPNYPYQLGKIQYDSHATRYVNLNTIYYKAFKASEEVLIPTTGIKSSDVCAVMVGWEDFVSDDAGGILSYGNNKVRIDNDKEKYRVGVYGDGNRTLSFEPEYEYAGFKISDVTLKADQLPKIVTLTVIDAFGAEKNFEIEFVKENLSENKIFNFDVASQYAVYESENSDAYNTDKGFIKFSEGWYMLEENLELGVSAYYSDRLTHKFTSANTSAMFEGATYIRRPKKSADYGNMGLSITS